MAALINDSLILISTSAFYLWHYVVLENIQPYTDKYLKREV